MSPSTRPKPWHTLDAEAVVQRLEVDPAAGLDDAQVEARRVRAGENRIPDRQRRSLARMLLDQLLDFMILVLIAAAVVSGIVGEPQDAIAILVIVLLNAIVGLVQEYRAERAVAALLLLAAPEARVRRDGRALVVPAHALVPGDIVVLEAGNAVPADLRLLDVQMLEVDESALTGESAALEKDAAALTEPESPLGDRHNLAFKGSVVTHGRGTGVVVATGQHTELGRIAALLRAAEGVKTPLQKRLARFGQRLALAILAICVIIFLAGILRGEPVILMFLTAVSLAVAAIPEALPAVITISLALGARELSRRRALVRRLPAVEALGSVTYICADKTGTVTENRMRAEFVQIGETRYPKLSPELAERAPGLALVLALSNDVQHNEAGRAIGDPTEIALLEFAEAGGYSKASLEPDHPRLRELPFDSSTKRMTTIHRSGEGVIALVKGAPEAVLPACRTWAGDASFASELVLAQAGTLAAEGYRVLAVASEVLTDAGDAVGRDLELLALVALMDPPREEVPRAVAACRAAGMTPVMITGDHPGTALAIARRVGIAETADKVITGPELAGLDAAAFAERVESVRVYARVDPEQKLDIVEALQSRGEYVAMTGDGVNDAPALKRADIGVAMGLKGTDVAREAADMVLLDDNFATIVGAVREGRRIYDNIRKFVKYTMTSNAGEIWTLFLAPFLGLPIPLLPIHILWINLVTDGLPGLALAAEPEERNLMSRAPRPPRESIFAHGMWQHMVWVGLLIGALSILGQAWAYERGSGNWQTVVFTVLTLSQLVHALAIRAERDSLFTQGLLSNRPLVAAIALTLALQMAVIYVPFLQGIFKTAPLSATELAVCFLLPLIVLVAVEVEKMLVRRGVLYRNAAL
jgi:Ca2+-transporting ATPase